jgi:hypothetical protein
MWNMRPPARSCRSIDRHERKRNAGHHRSSIGRIAIPVSSIGPARRRCLDQLRRHPAIAALIDAEDWTAA